MKPFFVSLAFLLVVSTAFTCPKKILLRQMTFSLRCNALCIDNGMTKHLDPNRLASLVNDFKVFYEDLCPQCKEWAQLYAVHYIEEIVNFLDIDL